MKWNVLYNILKSLLFILFLAVFSSLAGAQFSDVQKDSLTYMYHHQIVDGYSTGEFKPENKINRAELIKFVMTASNLTPDHFEDGCFSDVMAGQWYTDYVCHALKKGWVEGYDDGTFKPAQDINKVETLKIIAGIQDWKSAGDGYSSDLEVSFKDAAMNAWYSEYLDEASDRLLVDRTDYFYPATKISRGEVAEILFRAIVENKADTSLASNAAIDSGGQPSEALAAAARDFFRAENAVGALTYEEALTRQQHAEENPSVISRDDSDPENPVIDYQVRDVLLESEDGFTYGLMKWQFGDLNYEIGCEWVVCPETTVVLKFNQHGELVAYNWWIKRRDGRYSSYEYNITAAADNVIDYQEWWYNSGNPSPPAIEDYSIELVDLR